VISAYFENFSISGFRPSVVEILRIFLDRPGKSADWPDEAFDFLLAFLFTDEAIPLLSKEFKGTSSSSPSIAV
jgi:hypothetical protein